MENTRLVNQFLISKTKMASQSRSRSLPYGSTSSTVFFNDSPTIIYIVIGKRRSFDSMLPTSRRTEESVSYDSTQAIAANSSTVIHHHGVISFDVACRRGDRHETVVTGYESDSPWFFYENESNFGTRGKQIEVGDTFYLYHRSSKMYLSTQSLPGHKPHAVLGSASETFSFNVTNQSGGNGQGRVQVGNQLTLNLKNLKAYVRVKKNAKIMFSGKDKSHCTWRVGKKVSDGDRVVREGDLITISSENGFLKQRRDSEKLKCSRHEDYWVILRCNDTDSLHGRHLKPPLRCHERPITVTGGADHVNRQTTTPVIALNNRRVATASPACPVLAATRETTLDRDPPTYESLGTSYSWFSWYDSAKPEQETGIVDVQEIAQEAYYALGGDEDE